MSKTMEASALRKWLAALAVALSMLIGFPSAALAAPDGQKASIIVHDYISTTDNAGGTEGTWNLDLPLAEAMKPFAPDMKILADQGAYPHGRGGKNKIAYIEYAVTFPEGVTPNVGAIKISNKCSFINGGGITYTQSGQTVNFKIPLNDVNWAGIYRGWENDIEDPTAHTIKCTIPYGITPAGANGEIESSGNFAFYPTGFGAAWGFGLKTFYTDVAYVPVSGGSATTTSQTTIPDGTFKMGKLDLTDGSGGSVVDPANTITYQGKIAGLVPDGAGATIRATLNVEKVKDQFAKIQDQTSIPIDKVALSDLSSTFTGTFKLPEGVTFSGGEPVLAGSNGFYEIENYVYDAGSRTLTVTMTLSDHIASGGAGGSSLKSLPFDFARHYKTYAKNSGASVQGYETIADLKNAVVGMDDKLTLDFGVKTDKTNETEFYTIKGDFDSTLSAKASVSGAGVPGIPFEFGWTADGTANLATSVDLVFKSEDITVGTVDYQEVSVNTVNISDEGPVDALAEPKDGYEFLNWTNTAGNEVGEAPLLSVNKKEDGKWKAETYTAHFSRNIEVSKEWKLAEGAKVPTDKVVVELYRDGEDTGRTVELTKENGWKAEFTKLQVLNDQGEPYSYTVKEANEKDGSASFGDEAFKVTYAGDMEAGFTITNTKKVPWTPLSPANTSIKVSKEWKLAEGAKVPTDKVVVELYRDGEATGRTVGLTAADGWTATFAGVPVSEKLGSEAYLYTVREVGEKDGSVSFGEATFKVTYAGDMAEGFTITNAQTVPMTPLSPANTSIKVSKEWKLAKGAKVPTDKVVVELYRDGEATGKTAELTKENGWTATFAGVPVSEKLDSKAYDYTVREVGEKNGFVAFDKVKFGVSYSGDMKAGFTVTNTQQAAIAAKATPETGDPFSQALPLVLVLGGLALVGVAALVTKRRN